MHCTDEKKNINIKKKIYIYIYLNIHIHILFESINEIRY